MEPSRGPDPALVARAFEEAPVPLALLDVEGRFIAVNAATVALLRRPAAELVGLSMPSLSPLDDQRWTTEYLRRMAVGELGEFTALRPVRLPDGTREDHRLRVRPIHHDDAPIALIAALFPTETRQHVADARIRKLIENIDNTISLIDADGGLIETSGNYREILGYPSEFWSERTIFDLLHPDDAMRVLAMREEVLAQPGIRITGEFHVRDVDGSYQPLEVHAVNLIDDADVNGIVITSRNVSEQKRLLNEVAAARDAAVASAELRSRMMATVSHELRNPLHALAGLAELLGTSGDVSADGMALVETLRRQIDGLQHVVDDLLDESRLSMGTLALRSEPVVLRRFVDDIVAMGRMGAGGKGVQVLAEVAPAVPTAVVADGSRLRQVIGNLVGNAVKFTDVGSVSLHVSVEDGMLRFEILDTGRGISADDLGRVFEPFATASNAGSGSGAGLGLAIVRQLAGLMGGRVAVASELGVGTTFTVALPLEVAESAPAAHDEPLPPPRGARVLVVEDNEVNQLLARTQLERLGMQPVVVGSGEAALELLAKGEGPDLVLMDHQLPGIDGLETTRRLRKQEEGTGRRAIVISVSASTTPADRAASDEAGMDDTMSKPVSLTLLNDTLNRWLQAERRAQSRPEPVSEVRRDVLTKMADQLGPQVVTTLVRMFLDELQPRRAELLDAADDGDLGLAQRAAHMLKSTSLLLGAMELGEACTRIEAAGDVDVMRALVPELLGLATGAARELQVWLVEPAIVT